MQLLLGARSGGSRCADRTARSAPDPSWPARARASAPSADTSRFGSRRTPIPAGARRPKKSTSPEASATESAYGETRRLTGRGGEQPLPGDRDAGAHTSQGTTPHAEPCRQDAPHWTAPGGPVSYGQPASRAGTPKSAGRSARERNSASASAALATSCQPPGRRSQIAASPAACAPATSCCGLSPM